MLSGFLKKDSGAGHASVQGLPRQESRLRVSGGPVDKACSDGAGSLPVALHIEMKKKIYIYIYMYIERYIAIQLQMQLLT